jgi:peptidoglycan hydrolase-like protein with peptidoglycan-binding domain
MRRSATKSILGGRLTLFTGCLSLAICVLLLLSPAASASSEPLAGVSGEIQVSEAADHLVRAGILLGRDASSLTTQEYVTRGQLAIYLARALDLRDSTASFFSDVYGPEPYFGAVGALYEEGLIAGATATAFLPDELISREQAVGWIVDALGWSIGRDSEAKVPFRLSFFQPTGGWLGGFRDRSMIGTDHTRAVANACRLGIVDPSSDGWFYPALPLSWGDMAVMLDRAFVRSITIEKRLPAPVPLTGDYPEQAPKSEGPLVWYLEYRLTALKYRPGPVDGVYDNRTADAVMAFQKVEWLRRDGIAGGTFWERLAMAETPTPKLTEDGSRVEIDLTRQVLFMITENQVWKIVPVSSGRSSMQTLTGYFEVRKKEPGYVPSSYGYMYYCSWFDTKHDLAIHGLKSVPPYPASHGCVRVPMWMAVELYNELPVGTRVYLYKNK